MRRLPIVALATLLALSGLPGAALGQMRVTLPQSQTAVDSGDKVVITGMVAIPDVGEGAPQFTARDLTVLQSEAEQTQMKSRSDAGRCGGSPVGISFNPTGAPSMSNLLAQEFEASTRVIAAAGNAQKVTAAAEQARHDAADGKIDIKAVEDAELKRQESVRGLQKARETLAEAQAMLGDFEDMMLHGRKESDIDWGELDGRALRREKEHVGVGIGDPQPVDYLEIRNIQAHQFRDKKGKDFVRVSGAIHNKATSTVPIPALSFALIDHAGWVLQSQTVTAEHNKSIGPDKTAPFQVDLRPAPDALKTAIVSFAAKAAAQPRLGVGYFCGMARALSAPQLGPPPTPPLSRGPR
jgi:Protein of unknown function (DUF3426)